MVEFGYWVGVLVEYVVWYVVDLVFYCVEGCFVDLF